MTNLCRGGQHSPPLHRVSPTCPIPSPGFNFSSESVARSEGSVNLYHHLVETLKFAGGQRWRLWDPRSHLDIQVRWPVAAAEPSSQPQGSARREGEAVPGPQEPDWVRLEGCVQSFRTGQPGSGPGQGG